MALTSAKKTFYQERITFWTNYLTQLETIYTNFDDVESYAFDSGEGRQQTKFRSLSEVEKTISKVESRILRYTRLLYGQGVININLRRT